MARLEVRKVPFGWEHPAAGAYSDGSPVYEPLASRAELRRQGAGDEEKGFVPPVSGVACGYALYEADVTAGTPVTLVYPSLDELAGACSSGADAAGFGTRRTRAQWLSSFRGPDGADTIPVLGF